jgi:nucleoside phosphorylase
VEPLVATIGIVSALPVEAAATRLLIEDLERVPPEPDDRNQYYRGWLPSTDPERPHGVVLALLTQDSNPAASAACADLLHSFPALECLVLCGIAGGVPDRADPSRHVRLGDVVVAEEVVSFAHVRRTTGRRPFAGRSAGGRPT